MKQSQWIIAAFALAVMVFVLTFARNYLGDAASGPPSGEVKTILELDFPLGREAPADGLTRLEQEQNVPGSQDFWFVNRNDAAVTLGLHRTNCRCTNVVAYVLPDDRAASARELIAGGGPWRPIVGWLNVSEMMQPLRDPAMAALKEGLRGAKLKDEVESLQVPAGAVGFVRLHWNGEKPGAVANLEAQLWMGSPGAGREANLQVRPTFYEPVRVRVYSEGDPSLPIDYDELKAGVTRTIFAWSSTRQSFQLQAQLSSTVGVGSDPVTVGKPEPLTIDELKKLHRDNNTVQSAEAAAIAGRVLSGYKIKVTLSAMAADKTPFPVGPFSRKVLLTSVDAQVHGRPVTIAGRVVDDLVRVADPNVEAGGINFDTFKRSAGKKASVKLQSEAEGLTLVVDQGRMAKFLSARVSKDPRRKNDDGPSWRLYVEVLPGQARGIFPRAEEGYEDSAVYLKATPKGEPARVFRIKVYGIASEG